MDNIENIIIFITIQFALSVLVPNPTVRIILSSLTLYARTLDVKFLTLPFAYTIMKYLLNNYASAPPPPAASSKTNTDNPDQVELFL